MLRLLSSKQPAIMLLAAIIAVLLWAKSFIHPAILQDANSAMPFYKLVLLILAYKPSVAFYIALVLVTVIASLILRHNTKYILIQERSYLPAFIFIMLSAAFPSIQNMQPILFASILLLLAFEKIIDTYRIDALSYNSFDAAFMVSLGSLFYMPSLFFMLLIWWSLANIRSFNWREWLYSLMGMILPYLLLFAYYYILNRPIAQLWIIMLQNVQFGNAIVITRTQWVFLGLTGIIFLIASQYMIRIIQSKKIAARKILNLLFAWFFIALLLLLLYKGTRPELVYFCNIPLVFLLSQYFI